MRVIRELQGIAYWVIEDPNEIAELVNIHIRKEWESDMAEQEDPEGRRWLQSLESRHWSLKRIGLEKIRLDKEIMDYVNTKTGYVFRKRLDKRKRMLARDIDKFGAIIEPLVIRAEDNQLMDGYCRYHLALDRNIDEAYAYVGSL